MTVEDGAGLRDECAAELVRSKKPRPRFAIFYADGSVVEDDGVDVDVTFKMPKVWRDAPRDGVQFVANLMLEGKYAVLGGQNLYHTTQEGALNATDDMSPTMRRAGVLKHGLTLPQEEFQEIRRQVVSWRKKHE